MLFHFADRAASSIGCKEKGATVSRLRSSADWDKHPMALFSKSSIRNLVFTGNVRVPNNELLRNKIVCCNMRSVTAYYYVYQQYRTLKIGNAAQEGKSHHF